VLNFYARLYGPTIEKVSEARKIVKERLGRPVSNPMLLEYAIDNLLQIEDRKIQRETQRDYKKIFEFCEAFATQRRDAAHVVQMKEVNQDHIELG